MPQPEACVSLSVILFSLLSLQREMAALLNLVIAEDILLILPCSCDYIFVLPMYLFLQMIVEFHSRKDTSSVFNLDSAFSNVEEGQGDISRIVETTGNLSSVCALVSQADFRTPLC